MTCDLNLHGFDLKLKHTFRISREAHDVQPTLVVELRQDGVSGYGEATSNDYYGATVPRIAEALESVRETLRTTAWSRPEELWEITRGWLDPQPFAQCALDQAAHDLWGKLHGKRTYELWGLEAKNLPLSNYTIGLDTVDVMANKLRERPDWPIYKIKLGTPQDLEIVRSLRALTAATFRVDANCGWTVDEALTKAAMLRELGVEFIEQPLPASDDAGYRQLFKESPLPIMADESCLVESDVAGCVGKFHGINIKLVKCGGMTPARRMITEARSLGLKVMMGCMTESTVGISAIAQFLPLLDFVDMDGAVLLAEDIATGVTVDRGVCRYSNTPGHGVALLSP